MVRRFKLVNGSGAEWDLMRFDAFFHAPDGLGFSRTITSIRAGFDYIQTDEFLNQQAVTGEMVFDGYAVYREFVDFITDAPLSVGYAPQNDWYFRTCAVQSIGKTEIGGEGRLICPITFLCSGMWHETASANSIVSDIDSPKVYPYGYNYNYFESTLGSILISNGALESPIILSILGPVENPTWSLQQGGEVIANGTVTANIAEGHKLVVDARPDSMQIAEYTLGGEYVQDLYSASDFSTERFLYAPAGDSVISVSGIGGTKVVGKNKLKNNLTSGTLNGITYTVSADGKITLDGMATATTYLDLDTDFDSTALAGYVYTQWVRPALTDQSVRICTQSGGVIDRAGVQSITANGQKIQDHGTGLVFSVRIASGSFYLGWTIEPMIRAEGTPADYEQYREVEIVQAIAEVEKNVYSV